MSNEDKLQKEFLVQLGKRIKEIRLEKGLSQSEVANRCGKERQSYQGVWSMVGCLSAYPGCLDTRRLLAPQSSNSKITADN